MTSRRLAGFVNAIFRRTFPSLRPMDDEGHTQRVFVREIAMCALAVFAQALAVIRRKHDQGGIQKAAAFEVSEKIADDPI